MQYSTGYLPSCLLNYILNWVEVIRKNYLGQSNLFIFVLNNIHDDECSFVIIIAFIFKVFWILFFFILKNIKLIILSILLLFRCTNNKNKKYYFNTLK
jgi:hypothetical protein